ncbi:hypothetical protein AYI74_00010 [Shewanella algae]|nr:hypothetical protein AYI77_21285 [Shewanella algae]TWU70113.1 hypothetical protein AYI74_00010 [Shewanella algae]
MNLFFYVLSAKCCLLLAGLGKNHVPKELVVMAKVDILSLKQEEGKHLQFLATREQADPDKLLLCSSFKFS